MEIFATLIMIPVMLLNLLAGIVGGIGLLVQGDWRTVLFGLVYAFLAPCILSIALLPGLLTAPIVIWAERKDRIGLAIIAATPSLLWTWLIMSGSIIVLYGGIVQQSDGDFFHVLWGYSTAIGPWLFLAKKDHQTGNDSAFIGVTFCQFGLISMICATWIDRANLEIFRLASWFLPFAILGIAAQLAIVLIETRNERKYRHRHAIPASRIDSTDSFL